MGATNRLFRSVAIGAALMVFGAGACASESDRRDTFGFVLGETTHKEAQQILLDAGASPYDNYDPMRGYRFDDVELGDVKDVLPLLPQAIHVDSGYPPFEAVAPLDEAGLFFSAKKSGTVLWEIRVRWGDKGVEKTTKRLLAGLKSL